MNTRLYLGPAVALLLIIGLVVFFSTGSTGYHHPRTVHYNFELTNPTGQLLTDVDFWVYAPIGQSSNQKYLSSKSNQSFTEIDDKLGNKILHFSLPRVAPYSTAVINIKSLMALADQPLKITVEDKMSYIGNDRYLAMTNSDIILLASSLKKDNPKETLRNIYQWVKNNIKYAGYIADDRGAEYAYETKNGDCTEYMYMVSSLSRLNGIPTRQVGGYVVNKNSVLKAEEFHNWTEVWLDGKWQVVDAQKGQFLTNQADYIVFRIISNNEKPRFTPENTQRFAISNKSLLVKMK